MMADKKYMQLEHWLRGRIERGEYGPDIPIESENQLSEQFQISRATVRHALVRLQGEQLIERGQGRRSYAKSTVPLYRGRRHDRVGVISYALESYMFEGLRTGMVSALRTGGYEVVLRNCAEAAEAERIALTELMRLPLDGLIIEGIGTGMPCVNMDLYRRIEAERIPIVFTDGYHRGVHAAHVVLNDREIIHQMVNHLAAQGHERIGGIFNPMQQQGHMRFQGYVEGLHENNLEYSDQRVLFLQFGDRHYIFDNLFNAYRAGILECTAMVCYNDLLARFLEMTLLRHGISVPKQMSITGLDNCEGPQSSRLRLTSATHPQQRMGMLAAAMLIEMIETRRDVDNVVLQMPFVAGDTTVPVP